MQFAATWMQLEIIMLSKKKIKYVTTYTYNLKYDTNEFIHEKETNSENRLVVSKGEGGIGWVGISRCKLLYI